MTPIEILQARLDSLTQSALHREEAIEAAKIHLERIKGDNFRAQRDISALEGAIRALGTPGPGEHL